jgi:dienelactone hydrolase
MRPGAWALAAALLLAAPGAAAAQAPEPDCVGPAGDPEPNSAQWHQREQDNDYCGEQRGRDTSANPAYATAKAELDARHGGQALEDPFRDPAVLAGTRFRYEQISYANRAGQQIQGMLFRPCDTSCHDRPPRLGTFKPPYPGVVIVHGGAASQEMYLWGAEGLAEAGYMVLMFQIPEPDNAGGDTHYDNAKAALDYFMSRPELDRRHVGLAGHSAGGVAVSRLGQEDRRVSAIVSWDRAQSSPMPAGLRLRTPALFVVADFNCQRVPACFPQPYTAPPDPRGPGNKDEDFQRVSGAGVDSMKIALRAATHLDFTQLSPAPGSRFGAVVTLYYTLAWFDRYLRGQSNSLARLTATRFDDSADIHSISGGTYDPQAQANVPARIAGQRVADRLSFHFRSAYYFGRAGPRCADIRAGCPRTGAVRGCLARRSPLGPRNIGRVRLGSTRRSLARRLPAPQARARHAWRWCVKGGGGAVVATFSSRGRVALVASTAPGHGNRGVRPGRRSRRRGVARAGARSHRIIGVRRGRVRFVAVAVSPLLRSRRALRAHLRYARLR